MVKRIFILGQPVDAIDMDGALTVIDNHVKDAKPAGTVLAVNPEKIITLNKSPFLADFFRDAALLIPDGIGVVAALRLRGEKVTRCPGSDLMQAICKLASFRGYSIFLYGGKEEVSERASRELQIRYQGLQIAGRRNGYVKPEEQDDLIDEINRSGAKILFVALGSPRQEEWMHQHMKKLQHVSIIQGVGGTLDTIAGNVKRAPVVWQNLHLEWFYRLLKQPSRAPRQLKLFKFILDVLIDETKRRLGLNSAKAA